MKHAALFRRMGGAAVCIASAAFFARVAVFLLLPPPPPVPSFIHAGESNTPGLAAPVKTGFASVMQRNLMNALKEPPSGLRRNSRDAPVELDPEEQARLAAELENLPISKQGWELLGTIVDTSASSESRAILLADGKQLALAPGNELKGWRIVVVDRRTVVLEKAGRRERILLGGSAIDAPRAQLRSPRPQLSRRAMQSQMEDLPNLLRQAAFAPLTVNGVAGLGLSRVEPGGVFAQFGLQNNDLLVQINGTSVTSFNDLRNLPGLLNERTLRLEVIRNGKRTELASDIVE